MINRLTSFIMAGVILFPFFACEKWNLKQHDFIQVEITSIEALDIDSVHITAHIRDMVFYGLPRRTPSTFFTTKVFGYITSYH